MPLTGIVCPECGYDFPPMEAAKPVRSKAILVLALLGVVAFGLYTLVSLETTRFSAICAKCLQHAYIVEKTCLGICYHGERRLSQVHGGLMSSAAFSPPIPATDPGLYVAIRGKPCEHSFKKGGFGRTTCWHKHSDGASGEWRMFSPRLKMIEVTYRLFVSTKDLALARRSLAAIDRLLPSDARQIWYWPGLVDFAEKFGRVESLEQWEQWLDDPSHATLPNPSVERTSDD
jgi:hypothetical protein